MFQHLLFPVILIFSLIQRIYSFDAIRLLPVRVKIAVEYNDYFEIVTHKHRSMMTGLFVSPDHHHGSICRMMENIDHKHFMAYKGDTVVGCADLVTIDLGNYYHIQNVVVNNSFRR